MKNIFKSQKEKYSVKLAEGQIINSDSIELVDKGIRIAMANGKYRFVPYEALLWVDY